ncbi:MAG: hypothetical protein RIR26_904 [Pseudomonadota bacterium]|jgi:hypothetical protein
MRKSSLFVFFASLFLIFSCKPMSDSSTETSSVHIVADVVVCHLTDAQQKIILGSKELASLEKIELGSLHGSERSALMAKKSESLCTAQDTEQLSLSFPSIAGRLSTGPANDSATALALGGDLSSGWPGVVSTGYIHMPSSGARYLAGYNAAGEIIQLLRLMQNRPR